MAFEDDAFERMHKIMTDGRSAMMENMNRVHRGEPAVMRELAVKGERTPSQLADATGNSPGRISAILSALEKKGWATRTIDPENRRHVIVRITPEGERLVKLHKQAMEDRMRWVFGQMGERRTEQFLNLLTRFITYMSLCGPDDPVPDETAIAKAFERAGIPYDPAADRVNVVAQAARTAAAGQHPGGKPGDTPADDDPTNTACAFA
ncbi:MarR family winged helix-turn-helix transcriptional regulator [Bifidobacterium thermophilum]|uniref:MarR family winged helix-turn-helix transcriptional regulator n=1 Tax=Bifidobacterium thermophilum TaxID=33905 RepID=UPI0030AC2C00